MLTQGAAPLCVCPLFTPRTERAGPLLGWQMPHGGCGHSVLLWQAMRPALSTAVTPVPRALGRGSGEQRRSGSPEEPSSVLGAAPALARGAASAALSVSDRGVQGRFVILTGARWRVPLGSAVLLLADFIKGLVGRKFLNCQGKYEFCFGVAFPLGGITSSVPWRRELREAVVFPASHQLP